MSRTIRVLSMAIAAYVLPAEQPAVAQTDGALARQLDPVALFEAASRSIVVVEAKVGEGVSQGSGVVIAGGDVITNFHVVSGSRGLTTIRQGSTTWRAEITGIDKERDLARLTVLLRKGESFDLPAVTMRRVGTVRVGERVYAIGAPRGLERTLTEGLVSGLPSDESLKIIQTSAAISSGSSGGGLFDTQGRLLGITTLYLKDSQNLNFAVPSDYVQRLQAVEYVSMLSADGAPPSAGTPASATASTRTLVPLSIGQVGAVVLVATSSGPISTQGELTGEWLTRRVSQHLRHAGVAVFESVDDAREAQQYAVLLRVDLSSLKATTDYVYPWRIDIEVRDTTQFVDGERGFVTIWSNGTFGYGGSKVVLEQVVGAVDEIADSLTDAIRKARTR